MDAKWRAAVGKQPTPYRVEFTTSPNSRYKEWAEFPKFSDAFQTYAELRLRPGQRKRLVNAKGTVLTRHLEPRACIARNPVVG